MVARVPLTTMTVFDLALMCRGVREEHGTKARRSQLAEKVACRELARAIEQLSNRYAFSLDCFRDDKKGRGQPSAAPLTQLLIAGRMLATAGNQDDRTLPPVVESGVLNSVMNITWPRAHRIPILTTGRDTRTAPKHGRSP